MSMTGRTEAQKRADKKYRSKVKKWQVDLKEEEFDEIEAERKRQGLTRKEFLKKIYEIRG